MDKSRYAPEVWEGAVRLAQEHEREYPSQWAAIGSIAEKMSCTRGPSPPRVRQTERDAGQRLGLTTEDPLREMDVRIGSCGGPTRFRRRRSSTAARDPVPLDP